MGCTLPDGLLVNCHRAQVHRAQAVHPGTGHCMTEDTDLLATRVAVLHSTPHGKNTQYTLRTKCRFIPHQEGTGFMYPCTAQVLSLDNTTQSQLPGLLYRMVVKHGPPILLRWSTSSTQGDPLSCYSYILRGSTLTADYQLRRRENTDQGRRASPSQ